jgi:hypothetical protein
VCRTGLRRGVARQAVPSQIRDGRSRLSRFVAFVTDRLAAMQRCIAGRRHRLVRRSGSPSSRFHERTL